MLVIHPLIQEGNLLHQGRIELHVYFGPRSVYNHIIKQLIKKALIVFPPRFLRHVPVIYVDYPGPASLAQIYGTFNRAMLRLVPSLRTYSDPLTNAMVDFYTMSQVNRSPNTHCHVHLYCAYSLVSLLICNHIIYTVLVK